MWAIDYDQRDNNYGFWQPIWSGQSITWKQIRKKKTIGP